ncbi:hypothetical protein B0H34DRAFT_143760 [Crassisporium funariophilum]|nr:hypothetical protein B0H34DRAFT_143760 [Crassisporium funariophilum]
MESSPSCSPSPEPPAPRPSGQPQEGQLHQGWPQQQLSFPQMPIYVNMLANKMGLGQSYVNELFAFLDTAFFMTEEMKRVELFKMATDFRTHQAVLMIQADYKSIKTTLERVEYNMDHSTRFTASQTAEIRNTCRLVVFDPSRTDYTNPTVIGAVLARLKKYHAINGFKDYFEAESPTQARAEALKSLISTEASTAKSQFRLLISAGILGDNKSGPTSLTESLMEGMSRFMRSSDVPEVKHAVHLLIVRAFAQNNKHLLADKGNNNTVEVENTPAPFVPDDTSNTKKRKLTGRAGKDFCTLLTMFFTAKEAVWGDDVSAEGWTGYIDKAIKDEEHNHPDDKMPLIPRRGTVPAVPAVPSTPTAPAFAPITNTATPSSRSNMPQLYPPGAPHLDQNFANLGTPLFPGTSMIHHNPGHGAVDDNGANYNFLQDHGAAGQLSSWWS